jgi:glutathione S-transferase
VIKLCQAEMVPILPSDSARLMELGVDYDAVNVSASAEKRAERGEITGDSTIPVLVDEEKVFSDSGEILSYLEEEHEADPEGLKLHKRELSPSVYGTLPLASR